MDSKRTKIFYSPGGYWKGIATIKKIIPGCQGPGRNRSSESPKFDVPTPDAVHQAMMRLRMPSRRFTGAGLSRGQKFCRSTPGANSRGLSQKRWKTERHTFAAGARKFTATKLSLNVSTAAWLSACSATSTPWKCGSLRVSAPRRG